MNTKNHRMQYSEGDAVRVIHDVVMDFGAVPAGAMGDVVFIGDDGCIEVTMREYHLALGTLENRLTLWPPYTDGAIDIERVDEGKGNVIPFSPPTSPEKGGALGKVLPFSASAAVLLGALCVPELAAAADWPWVFIGLLD